MQKETEKQSSDPTAGHL